MAKLKFPVVALVLISLLMLTTASLAAASDDVRWSRVNIPAEGKPGSWGLAPGSDVQHLTMAIDGTLYAYGRGLTYTLYKSRDGGYRWSHIGDVRDSIVDIATSPADADAVYYATPSTVYRSADGGENFEPLPANPGGAGSNNVEITSIDVTRLTSNIIAAGTRDTDSSQFGGVYTLDEGEAIPGWVDSNLGSYDSYAVAFSPNFASDRQMVAVVTDETDTLVTTRFNGLGWGATIGNAILDRDNSGIPTAVAVASSAAIAFPGGYDASSHDYTQFVAIDTGSGSGDVYRINAAEAPGNSAATDLNIGSAYGPNNIDVTGLSVTGAAADARLLAGAADSARVYFSDDGGSNWTRSRKEPTGGSETSVLAAPGFSGSGKAYAATSGSGSAFSISQDSGATWNQTGLIDADISNIIDLAPSPDYRRDNTLLMLTFDGDYSLWRSTDGGNIWERIFASTLSGVDSIDLVGLPPQYGVSHQVIYLAGSSGGSPAIWKSADNGQSFVSWPTRDPDSGASFNINAWAIVDDATLFLGSYNGSNGLVYHTANSGYFYSAGTVAGSQPLTSLAPSPDYQQDGTILAGNGSGWVYWSDDDGASFEPLPPDAASPPLAGSIKVAFDPDFSNNNTIYAASSTADEGIFRFIIGTGTDWESIDGNLPGGGTISQLKVSIGGTLYATNSQTDGGLERSLNPAYSLGPTFETVTRGLDDNATLSGLWQHGNRLWSIDTTNTRLLTFEDGITAPVALNSPSDSAAGIGTIVNYSISNVSLDWEAVKGATSYRWQIDYDTDFSSVPGGFEGDIRASSIRLPALEPATTYYWRVRVNEPVLSPWSDKWSFTTSLNTEATGFRLESPEAGTAGVRVRPLFQWSAVPGAEAYELLVATGVNFINPVINKTGIYALPTTAWQSNISLDHGTTYYWKVRAIGSSTRSGWSAAGTFTTEPPPAPSTPPSPSPSPPPLILPAPATPTMTPVMPSPAPPPAPPIPSAPVQVPTTPDWVVYLIGGLLVTIILLLIIIIVLTVGVRRA